jgi:ketosteroid isomerase-like protein
MAGFAEFDQVLDASHRAGDLIAKGDPRGYLEIYSDRDDATLANPFGPPARGRAATGEALNRAAANYRDGRYVGFELITKYATQDLGYAVEIEQIEAQVGGGDHLSSVAVRVTSVFRREGGGWKLLHRHADPITSLRPADSVIQS